jgi:hypothetical protein
MTTKNTKKNNGKSNKARRLDAIKESAKKARKAPATEAPATEEPWGFDHLTVATREATTPPPVAAPTPVAEAPAVVKDEQIAADAAAVAANPSTEPTQVGLKKSTVENPTKLVWEIADQMSFLNPEVRRCDVVRACINAGIATHTAKTQYQRWFTAKRGMTK